MVQALKLVKSIVTRVRVIRRVNDIPQEIEIDLRHVVPGDVVTAASTIFRTYISPRNSSRFRWRRLPWRLYCHLRRGPGRYAGISYRRDIAYRQGHPCYRCG